MRSVRFAYLIFTAAAGFVACSSEPSNEAGQDVGYASDCTDAALDGKGVCRKPNGQFAKKVCCAGPTHPTERRDLGNYACPSGDEEIAVAFFDADSTLRVTKSGSFTPMHDEDVNVLPLVAPSIEELNKQGYLVAVVSNQGGVASGFTPFDTAQNALVFTTSQLAALGAQTDYLDFADQRDEFRKPSTGMADHLESLLVEQCGRGISRDASFMVGDAGYKKNTDDVHPDGRPGDDFSNSDRGFAENFGIRFFEPSEYFGWSAVDVYNVHSQNELVELLTALEQGAASADDDIAELWLSEVDAIHEINGL